MHSLLHTSKGLRRFAVVLACSAAVLAGCGDDESSDTTSTTAAAETDETTDGSEGGSDDTTPELTLPDTELCRLAGQESPDLSPLPDLLPEELRAEATQFAEEYNEWRATDGEAAPPEAPEAVINYITQECTPALGDDAVEDDAPAG